VRLALPLAADLASATAATLAALAGASIGLSAAVFATTRCRSAPTHSQLDANDSLEHSPAIKAAGAVHAPGTSRAGLGTYAANVWLAPLGDRFAVGYGALLVLAFGAGAAVIAADAGPVSRNVMLVFFPALALGGGVGVAARALARSGRVRIAARSPRGEQRKGDLGATSRASGRHRPLSANRWAPDLSIRSASSEDQESALETWESPDGILELELEHNRSGARELFARLLSPPSARDCFIRLVVSDDNGERELLMLATARLEYSMRVQLAAGGRKLEIEWRAPVLTLGDLSSDDAEAISLAVAGARETEIEQWLRVAADIAWMREAIERPLGQ
jgi:hypothetical protein